MKITFIPKERYHPNYTLSNCTCGSDEVNIEQTFRCEWTEGGIASLRIVCVKCGFTTPWQCCLNELNYNWNERDSK